MNFKRIFVFFSIFISISMVNGAFAASANLDSSNDSSQLMNTNMQLASSSSKLTSMSIIDSGWNTFTWGDIYANLEPLTSPMSDNEGPFTFTSTGSALVNITDAFLTGDSFNVYDNGVLIGSTPNVPKLDNSVWISDPDAAYSDSRWSHGSFTVGPGSHAITIVTEQGYSSGGGYINVSSLPILLSVSTSTKTINLQDQPNKQNGGNDQFTPATINILVKDSNGKPLPNVNVRIYAITAPGSGGHTHDLSRSSDSQTDSKGIPRPMSSLSVTGGTLVKQNQVYKNYNNRCNDLTAKTNSLGQVSIKYVPPYVTFKSGTTRVVAGTDEITVELPDHSDVNDVVKEINVRYPSFVKISDSNVHLQQQSNHDMEFYCTQGTMDSISRIASKFNKITKLKTEISATSLPWGGLLDIKGNWLNPHGEHQNGKCVDFALSTYSMNTRQTLKYIIMIDPNFKGFNPSESSIKGSHLHARFKA